MFLLFCGLSVVSGTGLKLLRFIFTLADCALRNVNATTVAASRHPDHRPLVTPASPELCRFPACYGCLCSLRVAPDGVPG